MCAMHSWFAYLCIKNKYVQKFIHFPKRTARSLRGYHCAGKYCSIFQSCWDTCRFNFRHITCRTFKGGKELSKSGAVVEWGVVE